MKWNILEWIGTNCYCARHCFCSSDDSVKPYERRMNEQSGRDMELYIHTAISKITTARNNPMPCRDKVGRTTLRCQISPSLCRRQITYQINLPILNIASFTLQPCIIGPAFRSFFLLPTFQYTITLSIYFFCLYGVTICVVCLRRYTMYNVFLSVINGACLYVQYSACNSRRLRLGRTFHVYSPENI